MSEITVGMSENKQFEVLEPDTYVGRCYMLVDLGTHSVEFKDDKTGQMKKREMRKVRLGWEIPAKMRDFGKGKLEPSVIGREFTASLGGDNKPSKLLEVIQGWRGRPFTPDEKKKFSLNKLVGAPALLSVVQAETRGGGRVYAKLNSVAKVPSGMPVPDPVLKPVIYSVSEGAGGAFNELPNFIKETIMASKEWRESFQQPAAPAPTPTLAGTQAAAQAAPAPAEDDVPF